MKVDNLKNIVWGFVIVFLSIVADQLSKLAVMVNFGMGERNIVTLINDFLYLSHVRNKGAGWSLFEGQTFILIGVTSVALVLAIVIMLKSNRMSLTVPIAMIIGGGLGNLYDRIFRPEGVVDFIDAYIFGYDFPVFNVADSILVCGTIYLSVYILFLYQDDNMGVILPEKWVMWLEKKEKERREKEKKEEK